MAKTRPINDLVLVELDDKKYGNFTSSVPQEGQQIGTLRAVSDKIHYLSSFTFVLEDSLRQPQELEAIRQYWKDQVGKKVRWEERAERGLTFKEDDKQLACIKLTKLIGLVEA